MQNTCCNIFYKKGNDIYLGATIRTLRDKIELFYHYPRGKNMAAKKEKSVPILWQKNLDNFGADGLDDSYLWEHVSFHTDGKIHSKQKDKKRKKNYAAKVDLGLNPFNVSAGDSKPIFVSSYLLSKPDSFETLFRKVNEFNGSPEDIICDITELNSFSIVLISICAGVAPIELLEVEAIKNLNVFHAHLIPNIFTKEEKEKVFENSSGFGSNLVVLFIKNTIDHSIETVYEGERIWSIMTNVCNPPIEIFLSSKNYN